ncbi:MULTISPECIES: NnrS family protein [unclassified Caballeronia]|uniref:NnrS family protein n=1 Tax=unclassified Caballeronia TaxID=2646786 RepID=UPI00285EDB5A|nr:MULTISPECIES: NnrS family protein [unclassified Caballeronia]MDR5753178.1 NnrS family protein [Caballeronia sp. LZ024]MDR5840917.1 NnrS family protein [Caballeronia sp. LZ031]
MKIHEPATVYVAPPGKHQPHERFALFNLGFRPFYLCGAACAAIALAVWLLVLGGAPMGGGYLLKTSPIGWHAHEMLFGFAGAVVVGFLLTAVRAWTGRNTAQGAALAALVALWLAARVLVWSGPALPAAIVDSAFMPVAALVLLRVLMQAGNRRNYFIVPVLLVFGALDAAFHVFTTSGRADLAMRCVYAAAGIVVLLVSVIGGRVIPMFTANAIPGFVARKWRPVELAAGAVTVLALFADAAAIDSRVVFVLAALACATHVARLVGWRSYRVRGPAILAVLHLAYAWIPLGFALLALSAAGRVPHTIAMHAFTAGVIGGAIIAMVTRTARGHTARPLVADTRDIASYALVMAGSALRVFGPLFAPHFAMHWIEIAGTCWILGFALYLWGYARPLWRARADGKPG